MMTDSINIRSIIGGIERALNKQICEFKLLRKTFRIESETHEERIQELEDKLKTTDRKLAATQEKLDRLSEYINIRDENLEGRGQIFAEQANREDARITAREKEEEESIEQVL